MKKLIFTVILLFYNFSMAARLFMYDSVDEDWDVTVKSIKWTNGEPKELLREKSYKKFKRDFDITYFDNVDKRIVEDVKNIKYGYIDVTNDGRPEIFVRETSGASGGYVISIFENKKSRWKLIFEGRGGFIFEKNENKKPFNLIFYERLGADHVRSEHKYVIDRYKLIKRMDVYNNDFAYHDYFWDLNETDREKCERFRRYPMWSSEKKYANEHCKSDGSLN